MDKQETLIVIGAGAAGSELAISARQQGWEGPILLVGEEDHLPYHRPPLSKAYLSGKADLESLHIRPAAVYEKAGIELKLGLRAGSIDRTAKEVLMADGSRLAYGRLALCLGGTARRLDLPGLVAGRAANLFYLRSQADAEAIRGRLAPDARMVIIGGGYVGLEVAASARQAGAQVTVLEMQSRVLARVTSPELSAFYESVHAEAGVRLITGATGLSVHLDAHGVICAVEAGGQRIDADLVVAGIGLEPNIMLAQAAGLAVDGAIVVDEFARTADESIYASGDCTVMPSGIYGRTIRLESVPNALEQSRVAAAALCGKPRVYDPIPWFWSDQYSLKLQMAGLSQGYDEFVIRGNKADRSFSAFYLKSGELVAVDAINRPADFMMGKKLVAARARVAVSMLADESIALKTLLPA